MADVIQGPWGSREPLGPPGGTSFGGKGLEGINSLTRYGAAPSLANVRMLPAAKRLLGLGDK